MTGNVVMSEVDVLICVVVSHAENTYLVGSSATEYVML
jgi:hypothetical protein